MVANIFQKSSEADGCFHLEPPDSYPEDRTRYSQLLTHLQSQNLSDAFTCASEITHAHLKKMAFFRVFFSSIATETSSPFVWSERSALTLLQQDEDRWAVEELFRKFIDSESWLEATRLTIRIKNKSLRTSFLNEIFSSLIQKNRISMLKQIGAEDVRVANLFRRKLVAWYRSIFQFKEAISVALELSKDRDATLFALIKDSMNAQYPPLEIQSTIQQITDLKLKNEAYEVLFKKLNLEEFPSLLSKAQTPEEVDRIQSALTAYYRKHNQMELADKQASIIQDASLREKEQFNNCFQYFGNGDIANVQLILSQITKESFKSKISSWLEKYQADEIRVQRLEKYLNTGQIEQARQTASSMKTFVWKKKGFLQIVAYLQKEQGKQAANDFILSIDDLSIKLSFSQENGTPLS